MNLRKMVSNMVKVKVYRMLYDKETQCLMVYTEFDLLTIDKQTTKLLLAVCKIRNAA